MQQRGRSWKYAVNVAIPSVASPSVASPSGPIHAGVGTGSHGCLAKARCLFLKPLRDRPVTIPRCEVIHAV